MMVKADRIRLISDLFVKRVRGELESLDEGLDFQRS